MARLGFVPLQDAALPAPLVIARRGGLPVLLSIPHSGRDYPQWLSDRARRGVEPLQALEDPLVDRLAWRALALGLPAVIARAPRAAIDCNRAEDDLDPALVPEAVRLGPRARFGLGLIPTRTQRDGPLWRGPLPPGALTARLDSAHRPFHRAIGQELDRLHQGFGGALLLDLHSMPPRTRGLPTIVIGDRHGQSAGPGLADAAVLECRRLGFHAAINAPFAGGEIVARHGRPGANVHALQIEIDRSVYCEADARTAGPGFERVARLIEELAARLGERLVPDEAVAAE